MTRQSLVLVLAALVTVAVAVAAVLMLRDDGGDGPLAVPTGTAVKEGAAPSAEPPPPSTAPSERPTTEPQASGLGGRTFTADPETVASASPVPLPPGYDGCDHNYGAVSQCVPWHFPAGITAAADKCEWLRLNGFRDLPVVGKDRQGLDANRDKIACNS